MIPLSDVSWPRDRAPEAIERLGAHAGFPARPAEAAPVPEAALESERAYARWLEALAAWMGLELEPVGVAYAELDEVLRRAAPALIWLPAHDRLLLVVGSSSRSVHVLCPELRVRRVPREIAIAWACEALERPVTQEVERWLSDLPLRSAARGRAKSALVRHRLRAATLPGVWLLRMPAGASFVAQARSERAGRHLCLLLGAHMAQFAIGVGSWAVLGQSVLSGDVDPSWLWAWALLLVTTIPFRLFATHHQAALALSVGTLLKQRLLAGALGVERAAIKKEGSGQLLGRTLESAAVESLALGGGFLSVLAIVELVGAAWVIGQGRGAVILVPTLVLWVLAAGALAWAAYRVHVGWTDVRRHMTNDLVEQMVGHRTRLAQQEPSRWHEGEDEALERYLGRSRDLDRADTLLLLVPHGWLAIALVALMPWFVQETKASGLTTAIALGGILIAQQALTRLSAGARQIASAAVAWKQVRPLFDAASRPEPEPSPHWVLLESSRGSAEDAEATAVVERSSGVGDPPARPPLVDAADLVFRHASRPEPVLKNLGMRVDPGDRILLLGRSGAGKSTLAAVLAGLEQPHSGLLLLDGVDYRTLGAEGWRRRVVAAPQYQDNHVLSETFAFNLLLGRQWPPSSADLRDAVEVCRELGLGDLLDRMPAGVMQMVGDSGWRLSHGERSRMFLARALLQGGKLLLLDESFAALDPKTLDQCLRCVLARAPALVVIAHP